MNNSQLPVAVRVTAAALAVFVTSAMLDAVISIAEPQQSQLMAHNAAQRAAQAASAQRQAVIMAQAPVNTRGH